MAAIEPTVTPSTTLRDLGATEQAAAADVLDAIDDVAAAPPVPPRLDTVDLGHVADNPGLAGKDARGTGAVRAVGTPGVKAGHYALAAAKPPASKQVDAFVAGARADGADPAALAEQYNGLSPADQRRATEDLIKRDPAAAARFAGTLAAEASASPEAKQAYDSFWSAVDGSTKVGGALFNAPEKSLAFMRAAKDFNGPGADRLRLDSVEHMYTGFLGTKSYRHFGADEAADIMADMLARGTSGPELVEGFATLPPDQQARFAARAADKYPVGAADFAIELRDAAAADPSKQAAFDEFRDTATSASERVADEWTLRTGTRDEKFDMLAKHYPDRFMWEVEGLRKSEPDKYVDYMQRLATHHPDRFAREFLAMDELSTERIRLDKSIRSGNSPAFRAIAQSRDPGLVEMKRSMAVRMIGKNNRAAFELFAADPTIGQYMLHNHRDLVKQGLRQMLKEDPKSAEAFVSGLVESFTVEYARVKADGNLEDAQMIARDMGLFVGEFREAAGDVFKGDPERARSIYERAARGLLGVAVKFHKGAAVAERALGWFDKAHSTVRSMTRDPGMSQDELEERFVTAFLLVADGVYMGATGTRERDNARQAFFDKVLLGIGQGEGKRDEAISN